MSPASHRYQWDFKRVQRGGDSAELVAGMAGETSGVVKVGLPSCVYTSLSDHGLAVPDHDLPFDSQFVVVLKVERRAWWPASRRTP
jgi:hypothetical protein